MYDDDFVFICITFLGGRNSSLKKIVSTSMFIGFVVADSDRLKTQQENKSAQPFKQLRKHSLFQVFCTVVVQRHFDPITLKFTPTQ